MRRLMFAALILTVVLLGGWFYWGKIPQVSTVKPVRGDIAHVVYATGVVEPQFWSKVTPLVRERILSLCHCEGQDVKKGFELGRIDDTERRAVRSELEAKRKRLASDLDRQRDLIKRGVTTEKVYELAEADLRQVEAQIAQENQRIEDYVLRAPLDGVVLRQDGEVGEISDPAQPLFWVGKPLPLLVIADVNEEDMPQIKVGQRVLLRSDAFAEQTLEGQVYQITPKGDPVKRTFRVRVMLPEKSPLLIGMTVELNIVAAVHEKALLVPASAVKDDKILVVEGGRVKIITVKTGIRATRQIEILNGLTEEQSVISPWQSVADQARVRVRTP